VKAVRVYLDYLYKTGRISMEERDQLKEVFKVKSNAYDYVLDVEQLVGWLRRFKGSLVYSMILCLLFYSGARLSEVIKMLRELDKKKLVCPNGFCRYGLLRERGRKRCDRIYLSVELVDRVKRVRGRVRKYRNARENLYYEYWVETK